MLGGAPILWRSCKQRCTSLSTTEADYVSLSTCARDIYWLRCLFGELGPGKEGASPVYEDNTGAIAWASDIACFRWNQHIDVRVHYMCELVDDDENKQLQFPTEKQRANALTKPY